MKFSPVKVLPAAPAAHRVVGGADVAGLRREADLAAVLLRDGAGRRQEDAGLGVPDVRRRAEDQGRPEGQDRPGDRGLQEGHRQEREGDIHLPRAPPLRVKVARHFILEAFGFL